MSTEQPIETMQRLVSAKQLATMLSISDRTLWRLASSGKLLAPIYIGGSTRWKLAEVERWIEDGCPCPRASGGK